MIHIFTLEWERVGMIISSLTLTILSTILSVLDTHLEQLLTKNPKSIA